MTTKATLAQGKHLMGIFENLDAGRLQRLFASGLFTDLQRYAGVIDPAKVDRVAFQELLGLACSVFPVRIGGMMTTDDIVAALRANRLHVHEWITQGSFPIRQTESVREDKIEIIDPGADFSEEEGLRLLQENGLRPPTWEHAIRFAWQIGCVPICDLKPWIIFLHPAWYGPDCLAYMIGVGANSKKTPGLSLWETKKFFHSGCMLAGVRPSR